MKTNTLYIDFEFGDANKKRYVSLICCSAIYPDGKLRSFSLLDGQGRRAFIHALKTYCNEETVVVAYGIDAEMRSFFSLFTASLLKDIPFKKFVCLYREHKLLANRCPRTTYGDVVDRGGNVFNRKYGGGKAAEEKSETRKYVNLINALYKFNKVHDKTHSKYKDLYRNMCIRNNRTELMGNIEKIIEYCEMDVRELPALHRNMCDELVKRLKNNGLEHDPETLWRQQLFRGWYGALIAQKVQYGYHVDLTALLNLSMAKSRLMADMAQEFNKRFPEYPAFRFEQKQNRWVFQKATVCKYIEKECPKHVQKGFPYTAKTKEYSVTKDTLGDMFSSMKHNLPPDDYLAQVYRYIVTASALRGIDLKESPPDTSKAPTFGNYLDKVERVVRPFYNDYGSQTSRSQPRTNGYLLGKPAWMRSALGVPDGHWLVSADFNKQEPLSLAVWSQDENLLEAYASGDLYASFGKRAGILKEGMDKVTWDTLRGACKEAVLGIFYGMGQKALAARLSAVLGRFVGEEEALSYIHAFHRSYRKAMKWMQGRYLSYTRHRSIQLLDGWTMWGGNSNERSIKNFPIQGGCAVAMRIFEYYAWLNGVHIPMTLHDGFYFYVPEWDPSGAPDYHMIDIVLDCMERGFKEAHNNLPGAELIGVEMQLVHPNADRLPDHSKWKETGGHKIKSFNTKYVDDRAENDLNVYGKYMWPKIGGME